MRSWLKFFWAYHLKYRAKKLRGRGMMWIAWRLPSELVMWCGIRIAAHATTGEAAVEPVNLTFDTMFKRWDDPRGGDRRRKAQLS